MAEQAAAQDETLEQEPATRPPDAPERSAGRARAARKPGAAARAVEATSEPAIPSTRNEVLLVGRLPAEALDRELPSGDVMTTWRLVVDRVPPVRSRGRGVEPPLSRSATVDALDCATWSRAVRRTLMSSRPGDLLEVTGSLHRRFWRSPTGPASRYEVDVVSARRVHRG